MKVLVRRLADRLTLVARRTYFSQLGEDAVLQAHFRDLLGVSSRWDALIGRQRLGPGYYVDIGAYSPKRISNTYWFYLRGWHGITVEPNPVVADDFRTCRPRDKHLTMAVSAVAGPVFYYSSGYAATSYIRQEREHPREGYGVSEVESQPLWLLLRDNVPAGQTIHLMSVDCEGHDLEVLESNDWESFRPWVVLAEDNDGSIEDLMKSELVAYMRENGYEVFSWTLATLMFRDVRAIAP